MVYTMACPRFPESYGEITSFTSTHTFRCIVSLFKEKKLVNLSLIHALSSISLRIQRNPF